MKSVCYISFSRHGEPVSKLVHCQWELREIYATDKNACIQVDCAHNMKLHATPCMHLSTHGSSQ